MNLSNIRVLDDSLILAEAERIRKDNPALANHAEFAQFCMTAKKVLRYFPKKYTLWEGMRGLETTRYLFGMDFADILPADVEESILYYDGDGIDCHDSPRDGDYGFMPEELL